MSTKNFLFAVALIVAAVIVQACLSGGGGSAGAISNAEYQALLDRLDAVENNPPGDKAYAGGTAAAGAAKSIRAGAVEIGTVVGSIPLNVPLHKSQLFTIKSPFGYLYTVPNHNRSDDGSVPIAGLGDTGGAVSLYFEAADCTGQAYVQRTDLSDYGASQGVVFRMNDGALDEAVNNPAQYYYVATGTGRTDAIAYQSRFLNISQCVAETGNLQWGYAALPNDPLVTAVESGPIQIPITIAEPGP